MLTTSQVGSLARKAGPSCLLSPRSEGVFSIRGRLAVRSLLLRGHISIVGLALLLGSHVFVWITPILGRGRCIFGVWGGHDISPARTPAGRLGTDGGTRPGCRYGRTFILRAAVNVRLLGGFPAQRLSECGNGTRAVASQLGVLGVRSRVRWLLERALSWQTEGANG
jgi:hypothetical protein